MHLDCGGYVPTKKHKPKDATQRLLPLVPKILWPTVTTTVTSLRPGPPQHLFTNDQDYRYFKVFCDITASNLAEYLDSSRWNEIVLQASEQESFIRHAVIALGEYCEISGSAGLAELTQIGALTKSVEDGPDAGDLRGGGSIHYPVAFLQYGNSINGIRKACEEQRRSQRTILIACLLAITCEFPNS